MAGNILSVIVQNFQEFTNFNAFLNQYFYIALRITADDVAIVPVDHILFLVLLSSSSST